MTTLHERLSAVSKSTFCVVAGWSALTPAHAASLTAMGTYSDYLLVGSVALLAVGLAAKAFAVATQRRASRVPVSEAEMKHTIGSYRNRVLIPSL